MSMGLNNKGPRRCICLNPFCNLPENRGDSSASSPTPLPASIEGKHGVDLKHDVCFTADDILDSGHERKYKYKYNSN